MEPDRTYTHDEAVQAYRNAVSSEAQASDDHVRDRNYDLGVMLAAANRQVASLSWSSRLKDDVLAFEDTLARIEALIQRWTFTPDGGGTHWDSCHEQHPDCLVTLIREAIAATERPSRRPTLRPPPVL
jgi:hypothetical protein